MRLLCQKIAVRAKKEDGEVGKSFESRCRAVRLCDDEALLACSAYVDLNPIRAKMAEKHEESDFTSIQRGIHASKDSGLNESGDTGFLSTRSMHGPRSEQNHRSTQRGWFRNGGEVVVQEKIVSSSNLLPNK